jgi:hypothetical protein
MYAGIYDVKDSFIKIVTRTGILMGCCQNIYNSSLILSILAKTVLPQLKYISLQTSTLKDD